MNQKKLLEIQTQRGTKLNSDSSGTKKYDIIKNECRRAIEDQSEKYRDLGTIDKSQAIKQLIVDYIMTNKPLVEGFIDEENRSDTNKLVDTLVDDITNYGILTRAMTDDKIYEIRCNGKEIKVEIEGRVKDLRDKNGKIISFESPEQQEIIMRKMLGDVRLTPKDQLVNARTIEGFRISCVHSSALGDDPNNPNEEKYHAFVLRKFKRTKMNLSDIVKFGTMSDGMARMLTLATAGGLTFLTCGPTTSGKTSTNNAILQSIPHSTRVILIQNPSEIDLRFKDEYGRVVNDVLHIEVTDKESTSDCDATMVNAMNQVLRLSPTLVGLGEIRKNKEFMLGMTILEAGHPFNATYHAEDSYGAVRRFLTAYMAESGEGIDTALATLSSLLNLIIIQKIMKDGTRKILQITEVLGVDPKNDKLPLLNDIYMFEITGEPEYDENGDVVDIKGIHKRVGKISDKMIRKLKLEGVKTERFKFLTMDVDENEVETYTGDNIDTLGKAGV